VLQKAEILKQACLPADRFRMTIIGRPSIKTPGQLEKLSFFRIDTVLFSQYVYC
jgi:hypothetical protein